MEAKLVQTFQPCSWMDSTKMKKMPNSFTWASLRSKEKQRVQTFMVVRSKRRTLIHHKPLTVVNLSSLNNSPGYVMESGGLPTSLDESLVLKKKSQEIEPYLRGRCIYLVGMMGSGKTTVGKTLSEVLGYSFFDSDDLVEETVDGMPVSEIFKQHGEDFFRDKETEVLQKLSMMHRLVVSTGGGAVIRPINWRYMQKGVSIWLDVPLECLARRISAVGTDSRPLLHGASGDAYTQALTRLSTLFQDRSEAYDNASIRLSFKEIAAKQGHVDVDHLTPTVIAIEVLEQIGSFLKLNGYAA